MRPSGAWCHRCRTTRSCSRRRRNEPRWSQDPKCRPHSPLLPGNRRYGSCCGFTDYRNNFHIADSPAAVVNEADTWDPGTNAVRFVAGDYSSEWSYNGDTMHLTVASPQLSYDLHLIVAEQVMYAKHKLGTKRFIPAGAPPDPPYYPSLPRVAVVSSILYTPNT